MNFDVACGILACHGAWLRGKELGDWLKGDGSDTLIVRAPDLFGHGSSREELDNLSIDTYVRQMAEELKMMAPVHLVGHSMGGLIMQKVAEIEPHRVRSVTLLASTPPRGIRIPFNWRFVKLYYLWAFLSGRSYYMLPAEQKYYLPEPPDTVRLGPESGRASREVLLGYPVKPLSVPVLVIAGEQDRFFPPHVEHAIARYHGGPNAHATVYPCGHTVYFSSQRERIRHDVLKFMQLVDRSA